MLWNSSYMLQICHPVYQFNVAWIFSSYNSSYCSYCVCLLTVIHNGIFIHMGAWSTLRCFFSLGDILSAFPLSVMCIQYGSANKGREEDGSSNVLSSNKIPLASSCHKHNATAVVSFSHCVTPFFRCLFVSIHQYYSSK